MEILEIHERIKSSIALGESHFREFKSALEGPVNNKKPRDPRSVARDICETLVSFANADGGELFIGVEDNGSITGVPFKELTIGKLMETHKFKVHKDTPINNCIANVYKFEDHKIIYFSIDKGNKYIYLTSDGKCLQRKDKENVPVSVEKMTFEKNEKKSIEYDREFVERANTSDLDKDLIKHISEVNYKGMSIEKYLQLIDLIEYSRNAFRYRKAVLLLFGKNINKWHPRCEVRIIRVKGTELKTGKDYNVSTDETETGNIFQLITKAWERLRPHLVETKLSNDGIFRERIMYPEDACREALTNAIAHRDYSIEGSGTEIFIFDDRMEVISPGEVLSTIKLEDLKKLKGIHQSRNSKIARVLREIGYMREMGEGMRRIYDLMRESDLVEPIIESKEGKFKIILSHKSVFSESDQKWLEGFKPLKMNREEMLVALLGKSGKLLSPKEIYNYLNLVDWDIYRSFIEQMQLKGLIYNVIKEKDKNRIVYNKNISKRDVPRLRIRTPEEVSKSLDDLIKVLKHFKPINIFNKNNALEILSALDQENIYTTTIKNDVCITFILKQLNLIDENKRVTQKLKLLWNLDPRREIELEVNKSLSEAKILTKKQKRIEGGRQLFLVNLDYKITQQGLHEILSSFIKVNDLKVPIDFITGKNRGYAFLEVGDDEFEKALQLNETIDINGRVLRVLKNKKES